MLPVHSLVPRWVSRFGVSKISAGLQGATARVLRARRRGIIAVQVLVLLVVLLGCVALSVDVGYICDLCGSMQSSVDASALAGASALGIAPAPARERAAEYAAFNEVAGSGLTPQELDITLGHWYGLTNTFVEDNGTIPSTPNAIRVSGRRPDISLFFAGIFTGTSFASPSGARTTVIRSAAAMQGAGRCLGVWGLEGIVGPGDVITDSYDMDAGAYGGTNVRANGDICSCHDITVGGNTEIHGDAIYGEGHDLTLLGTSYEIWGRVDDQACQLTPPTFDMPGAIADNDNADIPDTDQGNRGYNTGSKRLSLASDDNLTLPPGKYYFSAIQIVGQATLTITGPTEIYISGSAHLGGGGIINNTGLPENLKIFSAGNTMAFDGSSTFYGAVVAPTTDLSFVGSSTYYGMMIGKTLDFRGSTNIHVEESLVMDIFGLSSVAPMLIE